MSGPWEMTVAVTPSLNQVKRWQHAGQGWRLAEIRRGWHFELLNRSALVVGRERRVPPIVKCRVEIIRYGSRGLDYDNLVGGAKGLVDTLVRTGWLRDDSAKWAAIEYRQEKCKRGEEKTVVRVWE